MVIELEILDHKKIVNINRFTTTIVNIAINSSNKRLDLQIDTDTVLSSLSY